MKRFLLLLLIAVFSSCSVNHFVVEKRMHRKGFYVHLADANKSTSMDVKRMVEQTESARIPILEELVLTADNSVFLEDVSESGVEHSDAIILPTYIAKTKTFPKIVSTKSDTTENSIKPEKKHKRSAEQITALSNKAKLYFFLSFIPYAGIFFTISLLHHMIVIRANKDRASDPARVMKNFNFVIKWSIIVHIIALVVGLLSLLLATWVENQLYV